MDSCLNACQSKSRHVFSECYILFALAYSSDDYCFIVMLAPRPNTNRFFWSTLGYHLYD